MAKSLTDRYRELREYFENEAHKVRGFAKILELVPDADPGILSLLAGMEGRLKQAADELTETLREARTVPVTRSTKQRE